WLVGSLWPVPGRRGRHGPVVHHVARLSPDCRGRRHQGGRGLFRGPLHAGRGCGQADVVRPAGSGGPVPGLHAFRRLSIHDPRNELDVSGSHAGGRAARWLCRAGHPGQEPAFLRRGSSGHPRHGAGRLASRAPPLSPGLAVAAGVAAAVTTALVVLPLAAVARQAAGFGTIGPAGWAALRFTITQAVVSATISVGLAIPAARALARRQFRGRRLLILLLGA